MAWDWSKLKESTRADPYFHWASATEFRYCRDRKPQRYHVILELSMPVHRVMKGDWDTEAGWEKWLRIPEIYRSEWPAATYCTANVGEEFFYQLDRRLKNVVLRVGVGLPTPNADEASALAAPPPSKAGKAAPGIAVTAVIDDSLAFAHRRFQADGCGTRMAHVWNQDGSGAVPGLGYGSELDKEEIDRLLNDIGDEAAIYRRTGFIDFRRPGHKPLAWRRSHGTHVMDLAAGCDPSDEDNPGLNRPIIGVQLPLATTEDTSGRTLAAQVLDAVRYVLNRARTFGDDVPVAINLSYGMIAGPHDGNSILELALDQLIKLRQNLKIVLPSGNSRQARCYGRFKREETLKWRVQPDDATPTYLEIWAPANAKVSVAVTPPGGSSSEAVTADSTGSSRVYTDDERVLAQVLYLKEAVKGRDQVLIALAPTVADEPGQKVAPHGVWQVKVKSSSSEEIEAWIQRDDSPLGYRRRGRQSYFEDDRYVRQDGPLREPEDDSPKSYIKRNGVINSIATGKGTSIVGGFRATDGEPASYSAGGKPGAGTGASPNALAVSDDSAACCGVLAAGALSGSSVAMNGTSVAAPQITRWWADQMANGRQVKLEDEAKSSEKNRPRRWRKGVKEERGHGRMLQVRPERKVHRIEVESGEVRPKNG